MAIDFYSLQRNEEETIEKLVKMIGILEKGVTESLKGSKASCAVVGERLGMSTIEINTERLEELKKKLRVDEMSFLGIEIDFFKGCLMIVYSGPISEYYEYMMGQALAKQSFFSTSDESMFEKEECFPSGETLMKFKKLLYHS